MIRSVGNTVFQLIADRQDTVGTWALEVGIVRPCCAFVAPVDLPRVFGASFRVSKLQNSQSSNQTAPIHERILVSDCILVRCMLLPRAFVGWGMWRRIRINAPTDHADCRHAAAWRSFCSGLREPHQMAVTYCSNGGNMRHSSNTQVLSSLLRCYKLNG